jgi:regulator of replication initiation timing
VGKKIESESEKNLADHCPKTLLVTKKNIFNWQADHLKNELQKLQLENESLKERLAGVVVTGSVANGDMNEPSKDCEDEVNPWDVKASSDKGVDYEKLIIR